MCLPWLVLLTHLVCLPWLVLLTHLTVSCTATDNTTEMLPLLLIPCSSRR